MDSLKICGCTAYQKVKNKIQTSTGIPGKITVKGFKIKQGISMKSDSTNRILVGGQNVKQHFMRL